MNLKAKIVHWCGGIMPDEAPHKATLLPIRAKRHYVHKLQLSIMCYDGPSETAINEEVGNLIGKRIMDEHWYSLEKEHNGDEWVRNTYTVYIESPRS